MNDLIAADGKHHSSCHVKVERKFDKIDKSSLNNSDVALLWLSQELEHSASHADILEHIWERYCTITKEADITIQPSFISLRNTLKLAQRIACVYECVVLCKIRHLQNHVYYWSISSSATSYYRS